MTILSSLTHLTEGELLHLVDADASVTARETWTRHIGECGDCRVRFERLRRRTTRLSVHLEQLQVPADFRYPALPARTGRQPFPWRRAAAVMLLIVTPALAVTPLRASVAEWISSGWQWLMISAPRPSPDPAPATGLSVESGSTLGFTIAESSFTVEFTSAQADGELVLQRTSELEGTLEMRRAVMGEMPFVTQHSLRIHNSVGSVATYDVGIPEHVTRIQVVIGGEPPIVLDARESWERSVILLQARR